MTAIRFGTDGWRGVMADDFTFANIRLVATALARYLKNHRGERGTVIAYDCRFLSEHFARAVADVFLDQGLPVWLTDSATPTPVAAFAVRHLQAAGAVMITASHNPPEYNGIKFIPDHAGPATTEVTGAIERLIDSETNSPAKQGPLNPSSLNPRDAYLKHLKNLIDFQALVKNPRRVVVDPLYGAGIGYLESFFSSAGWDVEVIHNHRDPLFGGGTPDPNEENLQELAQRVKGRADLGLALDGDADRFGVIDKDGAFLTPNQVLCLILHHLLRTRNHRGPVARTVATTHMLDRIAKSYSLQVCETPVGFKFISQALRENNCIMGGEESGGMSVYSHVPEKDGILATALVAEIIATEGHSLATVFDGIQKKLGPLESRRLDIKVDPKTKERVIKTLPVWAPNKLAGSPVVERLVIDGTKVVTADGSWALIRSSGTEPLFRLYAEAPDAAGLDRITREVREELQI